MEEGPGPCGPLLVPDPHRLGRLRPILVEVEQDLVPVVVPGKLQCAGLEVGDQLHDLATGALAKGAGVDREHLRVAEDRVVALLAEGPVTRGPRLEVGQEIGV